MFSNDDVRELLQSFPPHGGQHGMPPSLLLTPSGQGLVTLDQVLVNYTQRVTTATKRIPLSDLATDSDVSPDIILKLISQERDLALLSKDGSDVIPKNEHDAIVEKLQQSLHGGIFSKHEFESQNNVDFKSLRAVLRDLEPQLVYHDDLLCTPVYEKELSLQALDLMNRAVDNTSNVDLTSKDLDELSGSPPKWLFLRHLERLVESPEYSDKVILRDAPEYIRIQAKHMRAHIVEIWSRPLVSGEVPYVDLQALMAGNVTHDSVEDVVSDFKNLANVEVIESFAVSETWFSKLVDQKLQALHYDEAGVVDIMQDLNGKLQKSEDDQRRFPESLSGHVQRKAEQHLVDALTDKTDSNYHRFGTVVLTSEQYTLEQNNLLELAKEDATSQWQQLTDNPDSEIKFNISNITQANPDKSFVHTSICKEKPMQKALDESFSTALTSLESQNEASFSTFWLDRVSSRTALYTAGLTSLSDPKLSAQLSSLLATYLSTDLVPDTLAKARTQHLLLSRKTRKNVAKLEAAISTSKPGDENDLIALLSSLEKFTSKQSIPAPTPSSLATYKSTMLNDMLRRSTKQSKSSNDALLFLTLIVVLHARYYDGMVYATGKYAPKIMKTLKGKVGEDEYAVLEGWKEDVRMGKLGVDGREGMRVMMSGGGGGGGEGKGAGDGDDGGNEKGGNTE